jgi:hypothetical protein
MSSFHQLDGVNQGTGIYHISTDIAEKLKASSSWAVGLSFVTFTFF